MRAVICGDVRIVPDVVALIRATHSAGGLGWRRRDSFCVGRQETNSVVYGLRDVGSFVVGCFSKQFDGLYEFGGVKRMFRAIFFDVVHSVLKIGTKSLGKVCPTNMKAGNPRLTKVRVFDLGLSEVSIFDFRSLHVAMLKA